jgi:ABC-type uncharacterized transport system auxiliary subunit
MMKSLFLAAAAAFVLSACGDSKPPAKAPTATPPPTSSPAPATPPAEKKDEKK